MMLCQGFHDFHGHGVYRLTWVDSYFSIVFLNYFIIIIIIIIIFTTPLNSFTDRLILSM